MLLSLRPIATLSIFAFISACSDVSTTDFQSDEEQAQETVARALVAAWNDGELDHLQEYGAESVLYHNGGETESTTLEDLKGLIAHWRQAFPDFEMHIEAMVTRDELTAVRLNYEGTHAGMWFGIEPTGKRINVNRMMFIRFEKGLVVEIWEIDDQIAMRKQLGLKTG